MLLRFSDFIFIWLFLTYAMNLVFEVWNKSSIFVVMVQAIAMLVYLISVIGSIRISEYIFQRQQESFETNALMLEIAVVAEQYANIYKDENSVRSIYQHGL